MGSLNQLVKDLKNSSDENFQGMLNKVKTFREHYTYKGVINQIEKFLYDPLGPKGGQLRCTRVPDKDHRKILR
jgi:CRISPR/Cas system-associated protein Cas7 (RAMP superfamily)